MKSLQGFSIGLFVGGLLFKKNTSRIGSIGFFGGAGAGIAIN